MGCGDKKLSKHLTQTFTAYCNAIICQPVTLLGDAEWPKVADAVIEAQLAYRKIWSDEKIERKAKEDGEAMGIAIGTNLLKNKSDAAKELISFLNDMYQEIGRAHV